MKASVASSALSVVLSVSAVSALAQTAEPAVPVTASVAATPADVTLSTVVVTGETTEAKDTTTVTELFAGQIEVNLGGPTATSQKVFVNGIEENNLNVQIDGARQSNNIWHHNSSTLLDPGLLKSATVEAGVAAADTGPGALGGSLSYETKDVADLLEPDRQFGSFLGGGYESNAETFTQSGAAYGRTHGLEALGYVSHSEGRNYEDGDGDEVRGTAAHLLSTLAKVATETEGGHRFELSGQYLIDDDIRPYRANFAGVFDTVTLAENQFTRRSATLKYEDRKTTSMLAPEALVYFNQSEILRPSPDGGFARGYFDSSVTGVGGSARNTFTTGLGRLTAGADFYSDESQTSNFRDPQFKERANNAGVFTQLRGRPVKDLELSSGVRVDTQRYTSVDDRSFTNTGPSANVGLGYALTPSLQLSGAYAYVFGGIPLAEAALFHSFPYAYSRNLDPQKGRNAKLGMRYVTGGLELGAEAFRTTLTNVPAYNEDPDPAVDDEPFLRINGPELKTRGFNLSAAYDWSHATISVSYTNTDVEFDGSNIGTTGYGIGAPVGQIFKLDGRYSWDAIGLVAGLSSEVALKFNYGTSSGNEDLDSYHVFNTFGEWKPRSFKAVSVRVAVNNLLDEQYVDRFTSGASLGFIQPLNEPGRNVLLSTKFVF